MSDDEYSKPMPSRERIYATMRDTGWPPVIGTDDLDRVERVIRHLTATDDGLRWTAMREALEYIRDIARGSTTANSLPHIVKIAERAILAASGTSTR